MTDGEAATPDPSWVQQRLEPLLHGWPPHQDGAPRLIASLIAKRLGSPLNVPEVGRDMLFFSLDLSHMLLKGMDDVRCLLVGGKRAGIAEDLQAAIRMRAVPGRVSLVFVANDDAMNAATAATGGFRAVVIGPDSMCRLLEAPDPISYLKARITAALPRRSLIPYDILHFASGVMFFGRTVEVTRLRDEDSTCFALTGPSRAGKTSIVRHYLRSLREERSPRSIATTLIDLMECDKRSLFGYMALIARRIGLKREPNGTGDFLAQLRSFVADLGQPVNLILDETDDLCLDDPTSTLLATAARAGLIRLVLCGRGDLFRTMLDPDSHFVNRLELLKIGPLDPYSATNLLVEPLAALGVRFAQRSLVNDVLDLTGRFPHLIQVYARVLAEYSVECGFDLIDTDHIAAVNRDHVITQYFMSPLQDLRDPVAKLIALSLLRDQRDVWTLKDLSELIDGLGVDQAIDLCNELVISNVLTWQGGGSYRLACPAMRLFSRDVGYLDLAYEEAKRLYVARRT